MVPRLPGRFKQDCSARQRTMLKTYPQVIPQSGLVQLEESRADLGGGNACGGKQQKRQIVGAAKHEVLSAPQTGQKQPVSEGAASAWVPTGCAQTFVLRLPGNYHQATRDALAHRSGTACGSRRSLAVAPLIGDQRCYGETCRETPGGLAPCPREWAGKAAVWEGQDLICAREAASAKKPCFCLRVKRRMSRDFRR